MPRVQIIIEVDKPNEVQAMESWFARWSSRLAHQPENHGCGCCVDIWAIKATAEATAELPVECNSGQD